MVLSNVDACIFSFASIVSVVSKLAQQLPYDHITIICVRIDVRKQIKCTQKLTFLDEIFNRSYRRTLFSMNCQMFVINIWLVLRS